MQLQLQPPNLDPGIGDLSQQYDAAQARDLQIRALQAQAQQIQVANQRQQALDHFRAQVAADPNTKNLTALMLLDPGTYQATKSAWDQRDEAAQKTDLAQMSAVRGYLRAGQPDTAASVLQQRIDADKRAGQDTSSDEQMLSAIKSDPQKAAGAVDYMLAAVMGPDKWSAAFKSVTDNSRADQEQPGKMALTAAQTDQATAAAEESRADAKAKANPLPEIEAVPGAFNPDGSPVFYNKHGPIPAAQLPADISTFADKLIASENSTGNPASPTQIKGANGQPTSTAMGNGQFLNGTWLHMLKATRPDLAQGKSDAEILAMRADPALSKQVTAAYAQTNAAALQAANLPVNGTTLAMAHKLGPGGAQAVLNADPNAPLTKVLDPAAIKANPQLGKLTAGQYAAGLAKGFGTAPISVGGADTSALTGDDYLATLPGGVNGPKAKLLRAIANGDQPGPTGRSAASGPGQLLMQQVLQYDPSASAINLDARKKTREAFTSGVEARSINSLNTVTGHLVGLSGAIQRLDNSTIGGLNVVTNAVQPAVGVQSKQKALADFKFFKTAVANELTKVFRGQNGAESDIKGWEKQLNPNSSPVELNQTVHSMIEAMKSRLESLGQQYSQGMGKTVDPMELLSPHARKQLQSLETAQSAGQPRVAVNPQTGQKVVWDPATGQWKPA
jgi:hypothetical protein